MENDDKWNNLPMDLLEVIAGCLDFSGNIKFSTVSKLWKSATFVSEVLLPKAPYLLLAEVSGEAPTDDDDDDDDDDEEIHDEGNYEVHDEGNNNEEVTYDDDDDDESSNDDDDESSNDGDDEEIHDEGNYEVHDESNNNEEANNEVVNEVHRYEVETNKKDEVINDTVITTRGLFCLSTSKTYNIDLPEASGKLILGTNKGWLLTLGRDYKINLLHPFSKHQIALPPMLTFASKCKEKFHDDFFNYITKVAMSSTMPTSDDNNHPLPVVMAIYGEFRILGFARPGYKLWTDVNTARARCFEDIAFHKNKFYAVNIFGAVFRCDIDDDVKRGGPKGTKIASVPIPIEPDMRPYLVESLSGHDLLLIVRVRNGNPYGRISTRKYYTYKFLVWKMQPTYSEHDELCNWKPVTNLGNESIFIGKTSSFSVSSSKTIMDNCIYFTDDSEHFGMFKSGGGHDMGIYSMEHRTIKRHFTGKSKHPFSPPLWYI